MNKKILISIIIFIIFLILSFLLITKGKTVHPKYNSDIIQPSPIRDINY